MANATKRAATGNTPFADSGQKYGLVSTAQTYYTNAAIGISVAGYATKCDDAASLLFVGINSQPSFPVDSGGSNGDVQIEVRQPRFITALIAAATVDDVGRLVYWTDDQTVSFSPGVYGNVAGVVTHMPTATTVCFEACYTGSRGVVGAGRTLAATGAQDITRFDVGKTVFVPNTATMTLTLPPIADINLGDWIRFVKTDATAAAITLDGNASETIDGSATYAAMDAIRDTVTIVACTSTTWNRVAAIIS